MVVGETWTVTIGTDTSAQTVEYTAASATVADVVAGLLAALQDPAAPAVFSELAWTGNTATGVITGAASTAGVEYTIVASSDSAAGTMAAVATGLADRRFASYYGSAFAGWLLGLHYDLVDRERAKAAADADRAYDLAVASRDKNYLQAAATYAATIARASIDSEQSGAYALALQTHAGQILTAEFNLATLTGDARQTLEIAAATADKQYAIDRAEAEKGYQVALLEEQFDESEEQQAADDHEVALAEANLTHVTALEDAKRAFHHSDLSNRKSYTQDLSLDAQGYALALVVADKQAALGTAANNLQLDGAFADAEREFWSRETELENLQRYADALAYADLRSAEGQASASAAQALDADLNSPWSQFLVDRALAQATWWDGFAEEYLGWVADRNAAETTAEAAVDAAYALQAANDNQARYESAVAVAEQVELRDTQLANAPHNYVSAVATPAETYANAVAQAQRDYAVTLAVAERDHAAERDENAYFTALEQAAHERDDALKQAENTYQATAAAALAVRLGTEATAKYNYVTNVSERTRTDAVAHATRQRDFEILQADSALTRVQSQVSFEKDYWLLQGAALATLGTNLASNSPSPWATYEADSQTTYNDWSHDEALARQQQQSDYAQAVREAEVDQDGAAYEQDLAQADADYGQQMQQAIAAQGAALAQIAALIALGQANQYRGPVPSLSSVAGIDNAYFITSAPTSDFYADPSTVYGWGGAWNGIYGYGGYGYEGYGYGYEGYGYGEYYGALGYSYGYVYGDYGTGYGGEGIYGVWWTNVVEPAELALPLGFWNLAAPAEELSVRIEALGEVDEPAQLVDFILSSTVSNLDDGTVADGAAPIAATLASLHDNAAGVPALSFSPSSATPEEANPPSSPQAASANPTQLTVTLDGSGVPHENLLALVKLGEAVEHLKYIDRDIGMVMLITHTVKHTDGVENIYVYRYYRGGDAPFEPKKLMTGEPHPIRQTADNAMVTGVVNFLYGVPQRMWYGFTGKEKWQLVAGPIPGKIGHTAAAEKVYDQLDKIAAAQAEALADGTFKAIPIVGTVLRFKDGEWTDGTISLVGDLSLGVGPLAKALSAAKYVAAASRVQKAAVALELSVASVRGIQGLLEASKGDPKAAGYLMEALLRAFGARLMMKPKVARNVVEDTLHGTGTRVGVIELSSRAKSVAALRTQLSREGATYEFVYLPEKNAFAINKKFGFTQGIESPHQYLKNSLTSENTMTVGGVIRVRDGKIIADEYSGHYGTYWNSEIRAQFADFMERHGFEITHTPFGN